MSKSLCTLRTGVRRPSRLWAAAAAAERQSHLRFSCTAHFWGVARICCCTITLYRTPLKRNVFLKRKGREKKKSGRRECKHKLWGRDPVEAKINSFTSHRFTSLKHTQLSENVSLHDFCTSNSSTLIPPSHTHKFDCSTLLIVAYTLPTPPCTSLPNDVCVLQFDSQFDFFFFISPHDPGRSSGAMSPMHTHTHKHSSCYKLVMPERPVAQHYSALNHHQFGSRL